MSRFETKEQEQADNILAWFTKKSKENGSKECPTCGCTGRSVRGVKVSEILVYLKQYYPNLKQWIADFEEGEDAYIEGDLITDIVGGYMDVHIEWDKELNRHAVVIE